jgi:thioester reductase-like protein
MNGLASSVEDAIASAANRYLAGRFDPDVPFALLGIDSLGTIEISAALEQSLGHELPPDLLLECRDGRTLAARLREMRSSRATSVEDPFEQMLADSALPDNVRLPHTTGGSTDLRSARRILLTGSTGFLGSALLKELLQSTEAEIVCLLRDPVGRGFDGVHDPRVRHISGDLCHARLGLGEVAFNDLANDIDAIVHCGAAVNWVYSYSALRSANVLGTLELLKLAARRAVPFHFISSVSVCYSADGPRTADESFDALPYIRGVQLGYAQTKIVAESLVRQAGHRGLPVRIYRPALISGDSLTGAYNRQDLITALIRGCVHMGSAPDLDWKLDCVPVDLVARSIVSLSRAKGPVFHIGHERPRHWRECVLWMRLYGYPLRLVPYHTWLRQLERETHPGASAGADHPLRPLRSFFLDRPAGARGLTLPELYEESRRTRADGAATRAALTAFGVRSQPLDAQLLETYVQALRACGDLPAVARSVSSGDFQNDAFSPAFLSRLLNQPVDDVRVVCSGSDHSIVSELTAWRSRRTSGLFRVHVRFADGSEQTIRLKVKAPDTDVIAVGEALASMVDPAIGQAYSRWGDRIGFAASHVREIEIYRQRDPRFRRHAPALLGSIADEATGCWMMALEELQDAPHLECVDDPSGWRWRDEDIRTAIDGLATLHSIWYGREAELTHMPWIGYVQSTRGVTEMRDLWDALARHAAPSFASWVQPEICSIHRRLIASVPQWWTWMEDAPRTLIHHDFNPRNVCLRQHRLVALDWELATIGAPQRDLAEFLCFVLPSDVGASSVRALVEAHRIRLEQRTGESIDVTSWELGFRAGLYDFLLNRLSIYRVVDRVRRQAFLPGVVRTWHRLYELFPLEVRG